MSNLARRESSGHRVLAAEDATLTASGEGECGVHPSTLPSGPQRLGSSATGTWLAAGSRRLSTAEGVRERNPSPGATTALSKRSPWPRALSLSTSNTGPAVDNPTRQGGAAGGQTYAGRVLSYRRIGFAPHGVPYQQAWADQRRLHAQRVADEIGDVCLLLEHPSVYTAGRRTEPHERPYDGTPVVDVDRGGKITWHGPGQLVGYPIVKLPGGVYVVDHVRRIEAGLIEVCAEFGVDATRVRGRSGVWTADGQRKLAAIGIRVSRGVSMHGFALNADSDLSAYDRIVPCGITDAGVTSLTRETGRRVSVADTLDPVERHLRAALESPARGGLAAVAG